MFRRPRSAAEGEASPSKVIRTVMNWLPGYWPATIALGGLGIAASLAESVGITLLILFVYVSMGADAALQQQGLLGSLMRSVEDMGLNSSAVFPVLLAVVILVKSLLTMANALLVNRIGHRITRRVRERVFELLFERPYFDLMRLDRDKVINVLIEESKVPAIIHASVVRLVVNFGAAIVFGVFLVVTSWQIVIIVAVGAFLHGLVMRIFWRSLEHLGAETTKWHEYLTGAIYTSIHGMRTFHVFALEKEQKKEFGYASESVTRASMQAEQLNLLVTPVSEFMTLMTLVVVMLIAGAIGVPFSSLLASTLLIYRLQPHLREMEGQLLKIRESWAAIDRVAFYMTEPAQKLNHGHLPVRSLPDAILFDGVGLTYPGAPGPSLIQVSLEIPIGKRTAIVGPSGAGKTSIISLLLRLIEPTSGRITVDGVDLAHLDREEWLGKIAVAGQDVELLESTVRDNIEIVRPNLTIEDLERVAQMAGLQEFVERLPLRYEEPIGDYGVNVSGGQRQRIGLARAFVADREILILDEATSALDGVVEKHIRRHVWGATRGRTLILITHRLANLKGMDHVICLEEGGRVVETGDPAVLMADPASFLSRMIAAAESEDPEEAEADATN